MEILQILFIRQRPMPGDDFSILVNKIQYPVNIVCQRKYIAACANVNKGEHTIEKMVPHVNDISVFEKHNGITISVAVSKMDELYMLFIDV